MQRDCESGIDPSRECWDGSVFWAAQLELDRVDASDTTVCWLETYQTCRRGRWFFGAISSMYNSIPLDDSLGNFCVDRLTDFSFILVQMCAINVSISSVNRIQNCLLHLTRFGLPNNAHLCYLPHIVWRLYLDSYHICAQSNDGDWFTIVQQHRWRKCIDLMWQITHIYYIIFEFLNNLWIDRTN